MKTDFFTLGETMIRLTPPGDLRLEQTAALDLTIGGAESTVAANLARLGKTTTWFSRLPDNPLGRQVAALIAQHGVDTGSVIWSDWERMGLYFFEPGAAPRPTRVWYDRAHSAASAMQPDELPLERLANARWLHLTGITPALGASCAATVQAAVEYAQAHAVTFSFDVNYRALLWDASTAARTLKSLCEAADVVFVAYRDACNLWGWAGSPEGVLVQAQKSWGGTVILSDGAYGVFGTAGDGVTHCPAIPAQVVDRLGAGDALAAGVICRLLEDAPLLDALRFGVALAALKLTNFGDIALVRRAEVEALLHDDGAAGLIR